MCLRHSIVTRPLSTNQLQEECTSAIQLMSAIILGEVHAWGASMIQVMMLVCESSYNSNGGGVHVYVRGRRLQPAMNAGRCHREDWPV